MKSNIKNSTKKLLLLAAATVTAASAVAIATGSSYSVRASAAENNIVAYSNDVYEDIYYRSGQYEIDDSGPINQSCDVFLWNHMPDYSYFVANGYQKVTVTIKMAMKEKNIWILILFLLCGIVVGGLLGELASKVPYLSWLAYGEEFGLATPIELNLNVIKLTFGLMLKINISSIIGIVLAIFIYKKV